MGVLVLAGVFLYLSCHYADYKTVPQFLIGLYMLVRMYLLFRWATPVPVNLLRVANEAVIYRALTYMAVSLKGLSFGFVAMIGIIFPIKIELDKYLKMK